MRDATEGRYDHSPKVKDKDCVKALTRLIDDLVIAGHDAPASIGWK
jgi:hypothetical protein